MFKLGPNSDDFGNNGLRYHSVKGLGEEAINNKLSSSTSSTSSPTVPYDASDSKNEPNTNNNNPADSTIPPDDATNGHTTSIHNPLPNVPDSHMVIDDMDKKNSLLKEINRIDNWANVASDNGLFDTTQNRDKDFFEKIQESLRNARNRLYANDLSESDYQASIALRTYNKALYNTTRKWRFSNIYGGPMWFYLIGFMVAVLIFYWFQQDKNVLALNVKIQQDALYAATWGTVGGILRGLWFLKDRVSDRKYRNSFRTYFLSVPFIGGVFGAFLYFILLMGFLILAPSQAPHSLEGSINMSNSTGTASTQTPSTGQITSNVAIIPLAILAGFNWEWAIIIFKRIGDSFKGTSESDQKIGK